MKKLFIFLLIFILASPAVVHACDCCIFNHSDSSQGSIQQKASDCCAQTNVSAKECQNVSIREEATFPGPTASFSETSPIAYFSEVTAFPKPLALLDSSGSPPNFPEKPLFLLHSVLRI